jgi:YidC/Oxa1 family membrane protein insertase
MGHILYTIIIFPVVQIIDFCFVFIYRVFHNSGIAIIGVSTLVTVCTLPLYMVAEGWQKIEKDSLKKLKPKIDKIKAVFQGDEQYMVLSAFYRQNHYHPVYAMRNTFGLLIQIPFFIAAYSYLAHLGVLRGAPFLFISDLGKPDALIPLRLGGHVLAVNILPLLMTLINCVSSSVYTKGMDTKDKIQLYGIAVIFLILLYNSPSGLVLYWMLNNVFSLIKNILHKTKKLQKIFYGILCFCVLILDIYVLFFYRVSMPKKIFFFLISSFVYLAPFLKKINVIIEEKIESKKQILSAVAVLQRQTFIFSGVILFLLAGLIIPSSLIASSTPEFSFIESCTSPFPFLLQTIFQASGFFLFWPFCIYVLFSDKIKLFLSVFMAFLCAIALINTFIFPDYYGFITITLILSDPSVHNTSVAMILLNAAVLITVMCLFLALLFSRKRVFFQSLQVILFISLLGFGIVNVIKIQNEFTALVSAGTDAKTSNTLEPVYTFSKQGKNVLVIMLDRAISRFILPAFTEKPELAQAFNGFTFYPNCLSFASYTLLGAPPLFGGYEYTPLEMNKRDTVPLIEKYNESSLLLPRMFSEAGYEVTVTDIPYAELKIFKNHPSLYADNIMGKYTGIWFEKHPETQVISISNLLKNNLIRFSFFKFAPPFLRIFIYDDGEWFTFAEFDEHSETTAVKGKLTLTNIDSYAALDYLPQITKIEDGTVNTFNALVNNLTHDSVFLQAPDYVPVTRVSDFGSGPYAEDPYYHSNIASYLLLEKYFAFLKENGVYDNTRIIIVSDHGHGGIPYGYNALLMVKDFYSHNDFSIDESFMTNADVPFFAVNGLIRDPINPFTQIPLQSRKENGAIITTLHLTDFNDHTKYRYHIGTDQWMRIHDNLFDLENWGAVVDPQ